MCGRVGLFGFSKLSGKQDAVSSHGQLTQTCLQITQINREHSSLCLCVRVSVLSSQC